MSEQMAAVGQKIFEYFGACAADPDDPTAATNADEVLWQMESLLRAAEAQPAPDAREPAGSDR